MQESGSVLYERKLRYYCNTRLGYRPPMERSQACVVEVCIMSYGKRLSEENTALRLRPRMDVAFVAPRHCPKAEGVGMQAPRDSCIIIIHCNQVYHYIAIVRTNTTCGKRSLCSPNCTFPEHPLRTATTHNQPQTPYGDRVYTQACWLLAQVPSPTRGMSCRNWQWPAGPDGGDTTAPCARPIRARRAATRTPRRRQGPARPPRRASPSGSPISARSCPRRRSQA